MTIRSLLSSVSLALLIGSAAGVVVGFAMGLSGIARSIGISVVSALFPIPKIALLPLLGVMLNGTSSVLYGTVPELTPPHQTERAFALFYTGTIGSGAIAPVIYGLLGDALGPTLATAATALTALAICPLAVAQARHLAGETNTRSADA